MTKRAIPLSPPSTPCQARETGPGSALIGNGYRLLHPAEEAWLEPGMVLSAKPLQVPGVALPGRAGGGCHEARPASTPSELVHRRL